MKASPKDDLLHQLPRVQEPGQTLPTPAWTRAILRRQETHPSRSSPAGTRISTFSSKVNWFRQEGTTTENWGNKSLIPSTYPQCLSRCYADASLQMANCPPALSHSSSLCLQKGQICLKPSKEMLYAYEGEGQQASPL